MRVLRGPGALLLSLSLSLPLGAGLLVVTPTAASSAPAPDRADGAERAASGLTPAQREAAAQVERAAVPRIRWESCGRRTPERLSCATAQVPLDYDRPEGPTLSLALTRMRAADPDERVGTVFVNPGGPGGANRDFVPFAGMALGKMVNRKLDVVGIDPRGTGGSGRTACTGDLTPYPAVSFPVTPRQVTRQIEFDDRLRAACAADATRVVDHASTADNARDMELVRRALREPELTYYGISYGTYLGATYAALFPGRIRAMVVDGVLDPVAWSTGEVDPPVEPFSARLGSGYGAYEALTSAFEECEKVRLRRCAISDDADGAWERVLDAAREGRLRDGGYRLRYQDLVDYALFSLYDGVFLPDLMKLVDQLDDQAAANPRARSVDVSSPTLDRVRRAAEAQRDRGRWSPTVAPRERAPRNDVVFQAVACSDSENPEDPLAWEVASQEQDVTAPWFGRSWTWASSSCAEEGIGSGADAFLGPWETTTSYPLLVVGNSHDPATPINGAEAVHDLFAGSRLVTWDGWAHGALGQGECVTGIMGRYLVNRRLPADGVVCEPERPLF